MTTSDSRTSCPLLMICLFVLALLTSNGNSAVPPAITVRLQTDRAEALRGESVRFTCIIENTGDAPFPRAQSLTLTNRVLSITVTSADETLTATEYDSIARDGEYEHGPRQPEIEPLTPHGTLRQDGDILTWLGELQPGKYQITAKYTGAGPSSTSAPVALHVLPVRISTLSVPNYGEKLGSTPLSAAFGVQAADGQIVIAQSQSQAFPRNPRSGLRVGTAPAGAPISALSVVSPVTDVAGAVWPESPKRLIVASGRPSDGYVAPARAITAPYSGTPVESPIALLEGRVLVPFLADDGSKAALLDVTESGVSKVVDLPVAAGSRIVRTCFLWHAEARLDAVWATGDGRELNVSRLPLAEPDAKFGTPFVIGLDDPVVAMSGYLDADLPRLRQPPDAPAQLPDPILFVVTRGKTGISILRANLALRMALPVWSIAFKQDAVPDVVSIAITKDHELAVLLKSPSGELVYTSTSSRVLQPLDKLVAAKISLDQQPQLFAASNDSSRAWVFARWINGGERISWAALEPLPPVGTPRQEAPAKPHDNDEDLMPRPPGAKDEH